MIFILKNFFFLMISQTPSSVDVFVYLFKMNFNQICKLDTSREIALEMELGQSLIQAT